MFTNAIVSTPCKNFVNRYKKAKTYTDKLTQSILIKAFRRELVLQIPNDESAEKLLEKIDAEREKFNLDKRKRRKNRRAGNPAQKKSVLIQKR